MNNLKKKIVATIIGLSMVVMMAPGIAQGVTVDELQTQITQLLAQLTLLQTQLATLQGTAAPAVTGCTITSFDRNLKQGMTGDDVKCLQIVLNSDAATQLAATGVGSSGNETSYFGPLTKAAVIKFQEKYASEVLASYGLTAGTGFVGTTTRAKLNSLLGVVILPTGCTVDADCPTGYTCTAGACVQIPVAAGLTVALSAVTPASTTIISYGTATYQAQVLVPFTTVNFTAGSEGDVKVTTLKFTRTGIAADANLDNTYLYEGDTKLLEGGTISSKVVTFNDATGIFTVSAGQTKSITLKGNLNAAVSAGKTIGFDLVAATDITSDASAVNGTFPISGNLMSVATATDLGYVTIGGSYTVPASANTSVSPQDDYVVWSVTLQAVNQNLNVERIVFTEVGSILTDDLQNFNLYYGGTVLGTVASMNADYQVVFDFSASPLSITKGTSKVLALHADIVKGSTKTFKFTFQYPTDLVVKDTNYGVYVPSYVTLASGWTLVQPTGNYQIATGSMSVTKRTDSPTGNVARDATSVSLAKYDFKAVGEDIKVNTLKVSADTSAGGLGLDNGMVYLDGAQVGSTIDLAEYGATATSFTFGTSFIVPAGTTSVVEIKADVKTATTVSLTAGETITIYLETGVDNAQGKSSLTVLDIPSSPKPGNALTVLAGALTFTKNAAYGNQYTVAPSSGFKVGSFQMLAGATEGVNVDSITVAIEDDASAAKIESLLLKIGADQIGSTKVTPSTSNLFSVNVSLAAGQAKVVDIYADVLSTAGAGIIDAGGLGVTGTGTSALTSTSANVTTAVALQVITVATSALSVNIASDNPDDALLVGLSSGVTMAKYEFASTFEAFTVSELKVYASSEQDRTSPRYDKPNYRDFINVWLSYKDSTGATVTTTKRSTFVNGMMHFTGLNLYVPASGTAKLTVYADLNVVTPLGTYALTGDRPQISLAYYKASSGSISSFERRTGYLMYWEDGATVIPMTWITDDADFDEADGTGTSALRFTVATHDSGDGAEIDIPLSDLNLTIADIADDDSSITFSARSSVANMIPMFTLFMDCDLDGALEGEIIWYPNVATIAANTWTTITIADNTNTGEWWANEGGCLTSNSATTSGGAIDIALLTQTAKIVGASFSSMSVSHQNGTYDVDKLVINAGATTTTTYNTNAIEDDMGALGTNYILYKTKPTVTMEGTTSGSLVIGTNTLYSFTVAADSAGDVSLKQIKFEVTATDVTDITALKLFKGATNYTDKVTIYSAINAGGTNLKTGALQAGGDVWVVFTDEETITGGTSQTYYLKATAAGTTAGDSVQTYIVTDAYPQGQSTTLDIGLGAAYATSLGNFIWSDRSYGSGHGTGSTSLDWINGYLIKTLGDGLLYTLSRTI